MSKGERRWAASSFVCQPSLAVTYSRAAFTHKAHHWLDTHTSPRPPRTPTQFASPTHPHPGAKNVKKGGEVENQKIEGWWHGQKHSGGVRERSPGFAVSLFGPLVLWLGGWGGRSEGVRRLVIAFWRRESRGRGGGREGSLPSLAQSTQPTTIDAKHMTCRRRRRRRRRLSFVFFSHAVV